MRDRKQCRASTLIFSIALATYVIMFDDDADRRINPNRMSGREIAALMLQRYPKDAPKWLEQRIVRAGDAPYAENYREALRIVEAEWSPFASPEPRTPD